MFATLQTFIKSAVCLVILAGSISACSTMVAPDDDGTTEYVFEQSNSDQTLSKDDSMTSGKVEED